MARGQERQIIGGGISPELGGGIANERNRSENRIMEAMRQQGERTKLVAQGQMQGQAIQAQGQQQAMQQKAQSEMQDKQLAAEEKGRRDDADFRMKEAQFNKGVAEDMVLLNNQLNEASRAKDWAKFDELSRQAEVKQKAQMWMDTFRSWGSVRILSNLMESMIKGQADEQKGTTAALNMVSQSENDAVVSGNAQAGGRQISQSFFDTAKPDDTADTVMGRSWYDFLTKHNIGNVGIDPTDPNVNLNLVEAIRNNRLNPVQLSQLYRGLDGMIETFDSEIGKLEGEERETTSTEKFDQKAAELLAGASLPERIAYKIGRSTVGLPKKYRGAKKIPTQAGEKYNALMENKAKLVSLRNTINSLRFSEDANVKKSAMASYSKAYGTGAGDVMKEMFALTNQQDSVKPLFGIARSVATNPMEMLYIPQGFEQMMGAEEAAIIQSWLAPLMSLKNSGTMIQE